MFYPNRSPNADLYEKELQVTLPNSDQNHWSGKKQYGLQLFFSACSGGSGQHLNCLDENLGFSRSFTCQV